MPIFDHHGMLRSPAMILTILVLSFGPDSVVAQQADGIVLPNTPRLLAKNPYTTADSLLYAMAPLEAYQGLEAHVEQAPGDYQALWRAARLAMALGIMEPDREQRLTWYRTAESHGLVALAVGPGELDGMVWTAAAKGRIAIETGGARAKARLGSEVWELTEQILQAFPDHPMGNDVRGKLNQEVMKLDGFSRFLGKTFLRSDPLRYGGWDSAESHLLRAVEADPGMVLFYLDLGETYLFQEKWAEASDTFRAGLRVADRYPTDPHFKRTMEKHLEDMRRGNRAP